MPASSAGYQMLMAIGKRSEAPVGLLYDPDDAHGLKEALGRARALTAEQRAALKRNALSKARDWDWSSLKGQIGDFFAAATSLASVGR